MQSNAKPALFYYKMQRNTALTLRFLSVTYVCVRARRESRSRLALLAFSYAKHQPPTSNIKAIIKDRKVTPPVARGRTGL